MHNFEFQFCTLFYKAVKLLIKPGLTVFTGSVNTMRFNVQVKCQCPQVCYHVAVFCIVSLHESKHKIYPHCTG